MNYNALLGLLLSIFVYWDYSPGEVDVLEWKSENGESEWQPVLGPYLVQDGRNMVDVTGLTGLFRVRRDWVFPDFPAPLP
jgi:hypothetical protein